VLARYFSSDIPVDTTTGKKFYTALAGELLDKKQAGRYNQAIMDFGAVICKPKNPLCVQCVLRQECKAYQKNEVALFPVKKKAIEKKTRWLCYFVVELNDQVYIRLRTAKDIWRNLYEFVLWETTALPAGEEIIASAFVKETFHKQKVVVKSISPVYKQQLTHQTIYGRFIVVVVKKQIPALQEYLLVNRNDVGQYPFPRFIAGYLQESAKAQLLF
jgi:A/G-specific adenine glycosylase